MTDSLWYKTAIFYEVYVRAFRDSDGDGHGDLRGLLEQMDYFQSLGVDCLWLLPIYPSPLKDDGYDIADYKNVLATYGSLDDFKAVLDAAHARGIRVITDLVMNHTSDQHPWFQQARSSRNNPYRDYYVWSDSDRAYAQTRIIFLDTEPSNWTLDPATGQYYWHRFYASQPDLNYDNPAVQREMQDIIRFWLDLGVDGFRADAVPYLFEREGTNNENLPETHAYLKEVRRFIDERYPGRILLGEANQWPEQVREYFGEQGDEFQLNFHFPLMPRIFLALHDGDRAPLEWVFDRTPPIPANCQWCTFLRNHDELTLEMVTPEERIYLWDAYAPEPRMRLNLGIRRRLAPLLGGDERKIRLAFSLLFSLPGAPILYYGDEIGMGDNIHLPDRDGVRTPMQWSPVSPNGGFSAAPPDQLYKPVVDGEYAPERVNVRDQMADPASLWNFLRGLIALRKRLPFLAEGAPEWVGTGSPAVAAFWRGSDDRRLFAVHNLSGQSQRVPLPFAPCHDWLSGVELPPGDWIELEPYASLWLGDHPLG